MKKQILIVGSGFSGMWAAVSAARLSALAGNNSLSIAVLAPVAELRVRPRFYEENVSTMVAPLTELRGAPAEQLAEHLTNPQQFADVESAWEQARRDASPEDIVVVCGSFHTVAHVMDVLAKEGAGGQ